jgi:N-acetylglucosaminyl-diphospho-decaprenol L-rhamnosyltransferase
MIDYPRGRMKLLVVILNYNVTDLTIDCLRSLSTRIQEVPGARVALVENGSGSEALERLRAVIAENGWGAWVDLIPVHPNRGFTGGNNIAIRAAQASADPAEYYLLLNADTLVHDGALSTLVELMDRVPRAGIAGSQLLDLEGKVQASPFRFQSLASEFDGSLRIGLVSKLLRRWWIVPPTPKQATSVEWVSGASMILRGTMLAEIGLLDEGLYTYFDDNDLCMRARRAGWETWYEPKSRVIHLEGASTGITKRVIKRRPTYWFQARQRYYLKNYGALRTLFIDAAFIVGFSLYRVHSRLRGLPNNDPPHMLADFIRHSVFCTGFRVREVENPALRSVPESRPAS